MKTLNSSTVNEIHQKLIFRLIWDRKYISRTAIRSLLGLSKSTVSEIVRNLMERGLVVEDGWENKTGGRKRGILGVNAHGPKIISLLLRDFGEMEGALVDLRGGILKREVQTIRTRSDPASVVVAMARLIKSLGAAAGDVLGIGLGVPGIVEHSKGVIRYSAHFGWRNAPLQEMLTQELQTKVPIFVDNRTISATLGEKWFGVGKGVRNFICFNCGEAVGAGIVLNGEVYRGGNDGAGEIGHISFAPDGPSCFCGKRGCIESLISLPSIMESLGETYKGEVASRFYLQDRMREEKVQSRLGKVFSVLGEVSAIFINLLVPERIIFSGELSRIDPQRLLETARQTLQAKALEPLTSITQLTCGVLKREEEVLGGTALVLEGLFGSVKLN
jgi:predicted NBD/HSP70 family sugar kinase